MKQTYSKPQILLDQYKEINGASLSVTTLGKPIVLTYFIYQLSMQLDN